MTFHDFLNFLLPEFDITQIIFGGLMLTLVLVSIVLLYVQANEKTWDKKWQTHIVTDESGNVDLEQSSINEISHSIASPAEKMIDVMPGILLIIGLLGTFLGLGIALNKASDILIDANSAGMDDAMANLMGMMEGLGTKFKTSTWGIIAFLLLKSWSAFKGYDEKRLHWCVQKISHLLHESKRKAFEEKEKVQQLFLGALEKLDSGMIREGNANRTSLSNINDTIGALHKTLDDQNKKFQIQHDKATAQLAEIITSSNSTVSAFEQFTTLYSQHTDKQLSQLNHVSQALSSYISTSNEVSTKQLDALTDTRNSLQEFIALNSDNLNTIKSSAQTMSDSAHAMGDSAQSLRDAIDEFKMGVGDVLGTIKDDLGSTIDAMGSSFSENMQNISSSMTQATGGISDAVTTLSENVGNTMTSVNESINDSMRKQSAAQHEFISVSSSLGTDVGVMKTLIEDLSERILSSLSAISSSNRQVASLNSKYNEITEQSINSANSIQELVEQLKTIQFNNPLQPSLDAITKDINRVIAGIEKLNMGMPEKETATKVINTLTEHLSKNTLELQDIKSVLLSPKLTSTPDNLQKLLADANSSLKQINKNLDGMNLVNLQNEAS
ncbi:hypothetical protein QS795_010825 [Providencia zhijiangensis]|uniref:MotA/TolQ/ExbB proton channel family protein n=1 Tax=Providencia zhijiangensis TaxID=3053982 RepID=A0ABZ0MZP6_9GAMM|nr:hypothetical protein [Providencia sp. D4759]WPA90980.1 hypothetical protein QS795_010825 [Providencia sp. D4759]